MFQARLEHCTLAVQAALDRAMAGLDDVPLVQAMRYASGGGKRLRAFLVMESAALHGGEDAQSVWAAAAVEAMHAYSLVHDDLPCMDDDDLRRGLPTVHVAWDEGHAVLVGDALQSLAYQCLTNPILHDDAAVRLNLVAGLARASGAAGMVLGQAQDMAAERAATPLDLSEITAMQNNKTGALIRWSAEAGAILGGADPAAMGKFAGALGQAFQIADDILDVEGDAGLTGKRVGKDADAGKATFVSLLGLEDARRLARIKVAEANVALKSYGAAAECLREAARFVISREI